MTIQEYVEEKKCGKEYTDWWICIEISPDKCYFINVT